MDTAPPDGTYQISKEFTFSASHRLDGLEDDHPCARLHGHNYVVRVTLVGALDRVGFVMDYRGLDPLKTWIDDTLDHQHLNYKMKGNPTAERLCDTIGARVPEVVELAPTVTRVSVSVSETPKTWATRSWPVEDLVDPFEVDQDRYRWGVFRKGGKR